MKSPNLLVKYTIHVTDFRMQHEELIQKTGTEASGVSSI